uniref:Uncharacterized protein n=1 Tax=candidate division CPR3 bacterium TaxID=2268181 RepID=A0A7V3N6A4_UNCC3
MNVDEQLVKEVLDEYYGSSDKSLSDVIKTKVRAFEENLVRKINEFDKKSQKGKDDAKDEKGDDFKGRGLVTEAVCPATGEKVELFRGVCQSWPQVRECYHGSCGMFPVMDKVPTVNVPLEPKASSKDVKVDIDSGVVRIGSEEMKLDGKTFSEKLRDLRAKLLNVLGVEKVKEIVNSLTAVRKKARVWKKGDVICSLEPVIGLVPERYMGRVEEVLADSSGVELLKVNTGEGVGYVYSKNAYVLGNERCRRSKRFYERMLKEGAYKYNDFLDVLMSYEDNHKRECSVCGGIENGR